MIQKSRSALITGILSLVTAGICILLYFLPVFGIHNSFHLLSAEFLVLMVRLITSIFPNDFGVFLVDSLDTFMFISIVLLALWAILSLVRLRFAGIIGVISAAFYTIIGSAWLWYAVTYSGDAFINGDVTPVPYIMPIFGLLGIVISIVQLVRSKRMIEQV